MEQSPVDLAIIDIQLKEGSGIGILSALQKDPQRFGAPRKVVLTNFAHSTMRQRCQTLGMDAFFDKSLHINELIDYITDAAKQKNRLN
jgi:DNA-binding NarL/FixJ family response regulator